MNVYLSGIVVYLEKLIAQFLNYFVQLKLSGFISLVDYAKYSEFMVYSAYLSGVFGLGFSGGLIKFSYQRFFSRCLLFVGVLVYFCFSLLFFSLSILLKWKGFLLLVLSFSFSLISVNLISIFFLLQESFIKANSIWFLQAIFYSIITFLVITFHFNIGRLLQLFVISNVLLSLFFLLLHKAAFNGNILLLRRRLYQCMFFFRKVLSFSAKLYAAQLLTQLLYVVDFFIITLFLSKEDVSIYYVAFISVRLFLGLADVFASLFFVLISKRRKVNQEDKKLVYIVVLFIICLCFVSELVINKFGEVLLLKISSKDYIDALEPMKVLIMGIPGLVFYKFLSRFFLLFDNWRAIYISLLGALSFNLTLNLVLVFSLGIVGVAFASSISYWIVGIMSIFFLKLSFGNKG